MPMTIIDATFENGVFVPAQRLTLSDHERVRLTIEPISTVSQRVETIAVRRGKRIRLNPALAKDIAVGPEFHPHGA